MPEPTTLATAGITAGALTLLGLLLRLLGPWRKQISDAEDRIREELHKQVDELREHLREERMMHATEMRAFNLERDEMGDRLASLEAKLQKQEQLHAAQRALDRHRLNNINQCFDALLLLIKAGTTPDDAVKMIEEMRGKFIVAEAEEKAIITAAGMTLDQPVETRQ